MLREELDSLWEGQVRQREREGEARAERVRQRQSESDERVAGPQAWPEFLASGFLCVFIFPINPLLP